MEVARSSAMSAWISAVVAGASIGTFLSSISIASAIIFNASGDAGVAVPMRAHQMSGWSPWHILARTCHAQACSLMLENTARPSSLMWQ